MDRRISIENVTKLYVTKKRLGIRITHKYWYLWNIFIDLWWFHWYLMIYRTDWDLEYKKECPGYNEKNCRYKNCDLCSIKIKSGEF